jgi:NAD(P)-dependent dehydrogenase (short-subunit alcohol dehydrogenase family)
VDTGLEGKVALVTGSSRGIGAATVRALAAEGMTVMAAARDLPAITSPHGVVDLQVDLLESGAPDRLVNDCVARFGRLDVLVNNVGAAPIRTGGFLSTTDEEFRHSMELDFIVGVATTRAALPFMLDQGAGSIVNIASVNAWYQPDGMTVDYGPAKAAVLNLTMSLAQEFGSRGIRVNAVSPGPVATDLWLGPHGVAATIGAAQGLEPEEVIKGAQASMATGRFTDPEEVANVVVLLASGAAIGNMTGSNVRIDGGLLKTIQ